MSETSFIEIKVDLEKEPGAVFIEGTRAPKAFEELLIAMLRDSGFYTAILPESPIKYPYLGTLVDMLYEYKISPAKEGS